jgi:mono/diheme cytochrome c family protein
MYPPVSSIPGAAFALVVAILVGWPNSLQAQSPAEQRGYNFVRANCASCHAIDKVSPSPLRIAPPFRTLHLRYPVENLSEAFAEGIVTGHPTMPEFRLDPGQIGDVIAYLRSLER